MIVNTMAQSAGIYNAIHKRYSPKFGQLAKL